MKKITLMCLIVPGLLMAADSSFLLKVGDFSDRANLHNKISCLKSHNFFVLTNKESDSISLYAGMYDQPYEALNAIQPISKACSLNGAVVEATNKYYRKEGVLDFYNIKKYTLTEKDHLLAKKYTLPLSVYGKIGIGGSYVNFNSDKKSDFSNTTAFAYNLELGLRFSNFSIGTEFQSAEAKSTKRNFLLNSKYYIPETPIYIGGAIGYSQMNWSVDGRKDTQEQGESFVGGGIFGLESKVYSNAFVFFEGYALAHDHSFQILGENDEKIDYVDSQWQISTFFGLKYLF